MIARIKQRFYKVLHQGESPPRLAAAFAAGVWVAFCPIPIGHTPLVVLFCWMFKLNPVAAFAGAFVNNPWTFLPIYWGSLTLGMWIWAPDMIVPEIVWNGSVWEFMAQLKPYAVPFLVGTTLTSLVAAVAGYFGMRAVVVAYRTARSGLKHDSKPRMSEAASDNPSDKASDETP